MKYEEYEDSKKRLAKLKHLTSHLCGINEKVIKNEKKKLEWTINYINDIIEKSEVDSFKKTDIVDLLKDIVCAIEEDDDNDE